MNSVEEQSGLFYHCSRTTSTASSDSGSAVSNVDTSPKPVEACISVNPDLHLCVGLLHYLVNSVQVVQYESQHLCVGLLHYLVNSVQVVQYESQHLCVGLLHYLVNSVQVVQYESQHLCVGLLHYLVNSVQVVQYESQHLCVGLLHYLVNSVQYDSGGQRIFTGVHSYSRPNLSSHRPISSSSLTPQDDVSL
ncbi:hypothetical protein RRG08_061159 [Elysia crispata]|uniref:Uncharacterized protein n=1 Tax=Elysia crispata TaxID=231223 RepID=A0AAE1CEB6_9GAST|nr:hypothetical protein RRG08_061159 [Elysia crispata]